MINIQPKEISDKINQLQKISYNMFIIRNSLEQLADDIHDSERMIDDIIFDLEDLTNGD